MIRPLVLGLVVAVAMLLGPQRASAQGVPPPTVSSNATSAFRTYASDQTTYLGMPARVCTNAASPNCDLPATIYGSAGNWAANLNNPASCASARWIWAPGITGTSVADLASYYFETTFTVTNPSGNETLYVAADDFAEVFVNGTLAGSIGSITNKAAAADAQNYLHPILLAGQLRLGNNVLRVHAQNGPGSYASCTNCTYAQNPAGVVFCSSMFSQVAMQVGNWFSSDKQTSCDLGSASEQCTGYQSGGLSRSRTLACGVTLTSWKDVIRLIYFGLRPSDLPLPTSPSGLDGEVSPAAVARRDCMDPCREELRSSFNKLFENDCGGTSAGPLQRAFRRDENSPATDFLREALNLEAGSGSGNKGFPFCNEFVPRVTRNVPNGSIFSGGCTPPGTSAGCPSSGRGSPYVCQVGGLCKRMHFGCAVDTPGDCPNNSVCDPGQQRCVAKCSVDADCSDLGPRARCDLNALGAGVNVCVHAVDGCEQDSDCSAGFVCDVNPNGGTCAPTQLLDPMSGSFVACNATLCSAYLPGGTCSGPSNSCVRPYGKICPVPGLVFGVANNMGQPSFGGTVAGAPGVARSSVDGIGFENVQDNDLLRSPSAGTFTFPSLTATEPDSNPAEQVASMCGDLGLVLPISLPPVETGSNNYPTVVCGRNQAGFAPAMRIQGGIDPKFALCPNGDMPFGSSWDATRHAAVNGTGNCFVVKQPGAAANDFRCLNAKNSFPARSNPPPIPLPLTPDGRVYNLALFGEGTTLRQRAYTYNGNEQPPFFQTEGLPLTFNQKVTGAFYRIHSTRTLLTGMGSCTAGACATDSQCGVGGACLAGACSSGSCSSNGNCGTTGGICRAASLCRGGGCCVGATYDNAQIGCLVEASPNSTGFAEVSANDVQLASYRTDPNGASPGSPFNGANFASGIDISPGIGEVSPNRNPDPYFVDQRCILPPSGPLLQYPLTK